MAGLLSGNTVPSAPTVSVGSVSKTERQQRNLEHGVHGESVQGVVDAGDGAVRHRRRNRHRWNRLRVHVGHADLRGG